MEINKMLDKARELNCSDLHFTVNLPPIVRQNGILKKLSEYPVLTNEDIFRIADSMTLPQQKLSIKSHKDTDFSFVTASGYRNRVNVFFQQNNLAIAIRLLRDDIPTFDDLGLPPILADFSLRPRGLVLVTGPTGSGKSTTLAAMTDYINIHRSAHIITIEDPIEYTHKHKCCMINQREVGLDVPDFAGALRAALREDPDVILVGEMRDYETINAAITAAETGHLVMSTLHTTSAATSIDRIIDVFPAHQQRQIRTQLASVLVGIVTQTLIPKLDNSGRVACLEILNATGAIRAMIRDDKVHLIPTAMQTGRAQGMQLLDQELARMVRNKIISQENALERCASIEDYNRFLSGNMQ